jgi:hypothetical protein
MTKKKRNPRHIRAELNLDSREFAIIERAAQLKNLPVAVFVRLPSQPPKKSMMHASMFHRQIVGHSQFDPRSY